jgi:hypothetical protein
MRVVIMCEESGIVRDEFESRGHDAWSCDILKRPGKHICDDARNHLRDGWDLMVAHPPCTRLCNSGVRWLAERNLWKDLEAAAAFFVELMNAPIPRKALENPVPHKYALQLIGRKYDQIIQPWEFGEPESKKTCLWLFGLPPLMSTIIETRREQKVWKMAPGPNRSAMRSKSYPGIAKAMAEQWG